MREKFLLCALLFFISIFFVNSLKKDYSRSSSTYFADYVVQQFGLATGALVTIDYDIQPQTNSVYGSYVLILLVNERQRMSWYSSPSGSDSNQISTMCQLPSYKRIIATEPGSWNVTIDDSAGSNQYSIVVIQCRSSTADNPVTVSVHAELRNPKPSGDGYNQLGIEQVMLVNFYGGVIIIYVLLLLGLMGQMFLARESATLSLHYFFLSTMVLYLINIILNYADYNAYNEDGKINSNLDVTQSLVASLADVSALASLLLLSLGWKTLRTALTRKEFYLCCYTIGSFLVFNVAAAGCLSPNSLQCQGLSLVAYVIRSLILLTIIIAMNFTVTQIRAILIHTPWVPSTPIQYARCKQYQVFRWIFILYLLLPTSYLILQVTMYTWEEKWLTTALTELTNILFLFHVGVTFSPLQETFLVRAFEGTNPNNRHAE